MKKEDIIRRILSAGYELGDGNLDGAQMINGEWWIPKWGCDSLDHMIDQLRYELEKMENKYET